MVTLAMVTLVQCGRSREKGKAIVIEQLIDDAKRHITAMESAALRDLQLSDDDARTFAAYAEAHPDETAYHVLLGLRRKASAAYARVPASAKAAILCRALATQRHLNDWGFLDPKEPHDGEAAQALLESGEAARPCLIPLLDDHRPALLFGSEEAAMSRLYQYRRSDFAYRYLSQLLGTTPGFDPNPVRRDAAIALLQQQLKRK